MPRRVMVFTSSRADLGPLGPVLSALEADPAIDLHVLATGTHMESAFGGRLDSIHVDHDRVIAVTSGGADSSLAGLGQAYGAIAAGVSRGLLDWETEVLVVLGDRWELLAAVGPALVLGVAVAHIHGGETTQGSMDERVRHAITKLSDLHLCASEDSAHRIRQLGEEAWRIVVTGAPGLDRIASIARLTEEEIESLVGMPVSRPLGVVVYHPSTVDRHDVRSRARMVLDASVGALGTVVALYPGLDPGTDAVMAELEDASRRHPTLRLVRTLGDKYLPFLMSSDVLVGNSSSGIIETASLSLPTVDIGERQAGRVRPTNVVHAAETPEAIRAALDRALDPAFRASIAGTINPYGDGKAADRIVAALKDMPLERLRAKGPVHLDHRAADIASLTVGTRASVRDAIAAIDRGASQMAVVVDGGGTLVGVVTDGDIRRALLGGAEMSDPVRPAVSTTPITAPQSATVPEIRQLMVEHSIAQVPLIDEAGRPVRLARLRDLDEP